MSPIVEGGIYNIVMTPNIATDAPKIVRIHMVLVLGRKPGMDNCWRVMPITSSLIDINTPGDYLENYIPFAPLRKKPYPIQLQLAHNSTFRLFSYLRIDKEYYVHADGLDWVEVGNTGLHCRLRKNGAGSIAQLQAHLTKREREQNPEKFRVMALTLELEILKRELEALTIERSAPTI